MKIEYRPIGLVHSDFVEREGTPIQGRLAPESTGRIEIFPEFAEGLQDVEGFSHLFVIYHFDRSEGYDLIVKPFLDDKPHGVFSVRAPKRPNSIGLSIVRLDRREGAVLHVSEIDILDQTPVLDIKPYVPGFDLRPEATSGWAEKPLADQNRRTRADDRFKN